jgi:hypothetical protein
MEWGTGRGKQMMDVQMQVGWAIDRKNLLYIQLLFVEL